MARARGSARRPSLEPALADALWRGVDLFRPLAVLYAAHLAWDRHDQMRRPAVAVVVLAALAVWSLAMPLVRRRSRVLVVAEVMLAAVAILATRLVDSQEVIAGGAPTLPSFWPTAGVVSAAIVAGWRGGLLAATVISAVDVIEVGSGSATTVHNIVLLLLIGGLIGYSIDLAREGHARIEQALTMQERVRERERLSRAVHDGVLQTLAFINRRATEIGGEARALADLAAEQERSLRQLLARTGDDPTRDRGEALAVIDLRASLGDFEGGQVQIVAPAEPVLLPVASEREVTAAVGAALDNVRKHAGVGAQAWVLIEDRGADVVVTVRDNGSGMPGERLAAAAADGRMGISRSISGRIGELGGECEVTSKAGAGTTVRMRVPREPSGRKTSKTKEVSP